MARRMGWPEVARAEWRCATTTVRMLRRGELAWPRRLVGSRVHFADGSTSLVYRETVAAGALARPAVLVVEFRLRLLGVNRALHALFRAESLLNTVLFAGFEGFRSKLWMHTPATGVYRGVYQWDGPEEAARYAEALVRVLGLVCEPATVRYHVVPATSRDDFLGEVAAVPGGGGQDPPWWQPASPLAPPPPRRGVGPLRQPR